jgi:hypothetical protein
MFPSNSVYLNIYMYVYSIMAMHPWGMGRYEELAKYIQLVDPYNSVAGAGRPPSLLVVAILSACISQRVCVCVCVNSIMAMHPKGMGRYKAPAKYILLWHTFSNSEANYETCSSLV